MTSDTIHAEAVEAAAYALYLDANGDPEVQWFDIGFHEQDELMRTATKALEAAAPHLMAAAWDACVDEAEALGWMHNAGAKDNKARNPYRPTQ